MAEPSSNYQAHTVVCVDLSAPGAPVTTVSVKIIDAHVTDLNQAFIYFPMKGFITDGGETLYPLPTEFVVYGHVAQLDETTGKIVIVGGYGMNGAIDPGDGTGSLVDPDTTQFGVSPGNPPIQFAPALGAVEAFESFTGDERMSLLDGGTITGTYGDASPTVGVADPNGSEYLVGGTLLAGVKLGVADFIVDDASDETKSLVSYRTSNTGVLSSNWFGNGMVQRVQDGALFSFGYGPYWVMRNLATTRDEISTLVASDTTSFPSSGEFSQNYYYPSISVSNATGDVITPILDPINPIRFLDGLRGGYAFYAGGKVFSLGRFTSANSTANETQRPAGQQCLAVTVGEFAYSVPGAHGAGVCPLGVLTFQRTRDALVNVHLDGEMGDITYNTDGGVYFKYVIDPHYATVPLSPHGDDVVDYYTANVPPFSQCYLTTTTNYACMNLGFGFGNPNEGESYGPLGLVRHYQNPYFFKMDWESGQIEGIDFVDTDWIVKTKNPFDTNQADFFVGPDTGHDWALPREAQLAQDDEGNVYLVGGFTSSSRCYSIYLAKSDSANTIFNEVAALETTTLFHAQRRFLYSGDFFQDGTFSDILTGATGDTANIIYSPAPAISQGVLKFDHATAVDPIAGSNLVDQPIAQPQTTSPSRISSAGSITSGRFGHTVTHLGGTRFMVAGGWETLPGSLVGLCRHAPCAKVEILDVNTGASVVVGSLQVGRGYHHCLDLGGGRYFLSGGDSPADDRYPTSSFSDQAEPASSYTPTWEVITLEPFSRIASGTLNYNPLKDDGTYIMQPPGAFYDLGLSIYNAHHKYTGQTPSESLGGPNATDYPTNPGDPRRASFRTLYGVNTPLPDEFRYTIRGHVAVADPTRGKIHIVGGYHGLSIAFAAVDDGVTGVDSRYGSRSLTKLVDVPYPVVLGEGRAGGNGEVVQVSNPYGTPDPALSNNLLLPWYPAGSGTTYFFDDLDSGDLDTRLSMARVIEPMFLWDHGPFGEKNGIEGLHDRGLYAFVPLMSQVVLSINADW